MNSSMIKLLGRTHTSYRLFIFTLVGLSILLLSCGQDKKSQLVARAARRKKTKILSPNRKAINFNRQGAFYADIWQFDSAFACFHQALELSEQFDLKDRKFAALTNIANTFDIRANFYDKTEEQGKLDLDSAGIYYIRCLEFISTLNDTAKEVKLLIDIGIFYHDGLLNFDRAESLFNRAIELSHHVGKKKDEGHALFCRGYLRYHKLELTKALHDFLAALPLLKKGAGEYFINLDIYYINLLDKLIIKQKNVPKSEWEQYIAYHKKNIKNMRDYMKELQVVEPLKDGGK